MFGFSLLRALILCSTLLATLSSAHGDPSETLYVAGNGSDAGHCDDPAAPCRSIAHALRQAGRNTQIRVAAGLYPIEQQEDLFLLLSGVIDVVGGFDQRTAYATRGKAVSILSGVPAAYRRQLRQRGFHVIADRKSIEGEDAARAEDRLKLHGKLQKGTATGPCENGLAGELACEGVDLLSHVGLNEVSAAPTRASDVWGFTDLNTGREYAIVGFNLGTGIFDVTDPGQPREVGFIDGQTAGWRDMKVYQYHDAAADRWHTYAYVTSDGAADGLFVIDLGGLPHSVRRVPYASDFASAHNVHAANTDFSTGLSLTEDAPQLIVAGSNLNAGQFRAYSLATPDAPQPIQAGTVPDSFDDNDSSYMHDAASLLITDERKNSQCINGDVHCELLLDFNEENVEIWDITNSADPQHLNPDRQPYAQRGYVHSGSWSEDRQFMFVQDETDEQQFGLNTTLRIFSIADLARPALQGTWTGPTAATDHNGFVRGNRYYMSNYSRGLTILDITDPANPAAAGYLDTYPFSDRSGFVGAWGVYPYFTSGTVVISDINSGLYLARDRTRDVAAGRLAFDAASYAATESRTARIGVDRRGGSAGAVGTTVEAVHATADASDYAIFPAELNWADGDSTTRFVELNAINDTLPESLELVLLRLSAPRGGATLAEPDIARIHLSDPAAPAELRLFTEQIDIAERGFGTAVVVLQRHGNASGTASVDYAVYPASATPGSDFGGADSGTLSWSAGDGSPRWIEFPISDDRMAEEDEYFEVTLGNAQGAALAGATTARVTIRDGSGINRAPNAIVTDSITAAENTPVTLDGSRSNDPDGDDLRFAWKQTSGPAVSLDNPNAASTVFTAPPVGSDTILQFTLTVSDPAGLSDSATVVVTVTGNAAPGNDSGGSGAAGALLLSALAAAFYGRGRSRRAIRTGAA